MSYKNNESGKFAKRKGLFERLPFVKSEEITIEKDEMGMPEDVHQDSGDYSVPKMIPISIGLTKFYTKEGPYFGKVTLDLVLKNHEKAVNYGPIISVDAQKEQIIDVFKQMQKSYQDKTKEEFEGSLEKISEELQEKLSEKTRGRIGYSVERLVLSPRNDLNVTDYIKKNEKAQEYFRETSKKNKELKKDLEETRSQLKDTELKKNKLHKEKEQLENDVREQKRILGEAYKQQQKAYETYTFLEKNISSTQEVLYTKRDELSKVEGALEEKNTTLEDLADELDKCQTLKEKQNDEIAKLAELSLKVAEEKLSLDKSVSEKRDEMESISERLAELSKEKEKNKSEIEATKTVYNQLSKDKELLSYEVAEKQKEMAAINDTLTNWKATKDTHTSAILTLEKQIADKRAEKENLEAQIPEYMNKIQQLDSDIKEKSEHSKRMGDFVEKFTVDLRDTEIEAIKAALKPKAEYLVDSNPELYTKGDAAENIEFTHRILTKGAMKAFTANPNKKYRVDELIEMVSPEEQERIEIDVQKRKYREMVM